MRLNQRGEGEGGAILFIVIIVALVAFISNQSNDKPVKWQLTYLNQANLSTVAGIYDTREECNQKLQEALNNPRMDRPECGSNCKPSETFTDMYVCDETFEL